ncbi:MAG: histidine kinase [Bacteroidetes bacterium]|nr:histidine kinase [Bacteroidota bacterium]
MRWLLPLLAIVVWTLHYAFLSQFLDAPNNLALTESFINIAALGLFTWLMLLSINAYPTRVGLTLYAIIVGSFFAFASGYSTLFILKKYVAADNNTYENWLALTMPIRYFVNWLICCWVATFSAVEKQKQKIENKFLKQNDITNLHREAELYKLRQQLQPHFLYNSLNSISALTMIAPEKAQEMIGKLSDFLRSSVKREGQEQIPVNEELSYIESYLSIEAIRFGDRLKVNIEKHFNNDAMIPPFVLQPVLENAIKFGLYGRTGNVTITVSIENQDNILIVKVTNPFDADNQTPRGTGFGLEGIKRRLYLLYARTDLLETQKNEDTFTTILKIPQHV